MKKHISVLKALIVISAIIPFYQNCGQLKSSGTNGSLATTETRNSAFGFKVFDASYSEIKDAIPTFDVNQKYNFRIDKKLIGENALIFWDLINLGASCDLKIFEGDESAELVCFSGGDIGVSVTVLYPDGNEIYGEIKAFVFDSGIVIPGSNITPVTITIGASGNTQNWSINNIPTSEVNVRSGNATTGSVTVYKNQPIRILNNDDELHQPKGTDSDLCKKAPFPLQTGQSYDCIPKVKMETVGAYIEDALDDMGAGGRFNFRVLDSKAIHDDVNCTACHGRKSAASPAALYNRIRETLNSASGGPVPAMISQYGDISANATNGNNPLSLTDDQIRAIAFYMYYNPK